MTIRIEKDDKGADHFAVDGAEGAGMALGLALDLAESIARVAAESIVLTKQRRKVLVDALTMYAKLVALDAQGAQSEDFAAARATPAGGTEP